MGSMKGNNTSSNIGSNVDRLKKRGNYAEMKDGYLTSKKKKRDMTVLSTGWHLLCTPHTFGAHKKNEPFTAAHFLTIKALQRKKQKAQTLESYPHEYLPAVFFPSLYPPVDSLSDSYKTYPSRVYSTFIEWAVDIFSDLEQQTKSLCH